MRADIAFETRGPEEDGDLVHGIENEGVFVNLALRGVDLEGNPPVLGAQVHPRPGLVVLFGRSVGQHGILVNSVCPGFFLTDRVKELAEKNAEKAGLKPQDFIERWAGQSVLNRVAESEEFGPLVAFLCSQKAGYITGTAIAIDGGFSKGLM